MNPNWNPRWNQPEEQRSPTQWNPNWNRSRNTPIQENPPPPPQLLHTPPQPFPSPTVSPTQNSTHASPQFNYASPVQPLPSPVLHTPTRTTTAASPRRQRTPRSNRRPSAAARSPRRQQSTQRGAVAPASRFHPLTLRQQYQNLPPQEEGPARLTEVAYLEGRPLFLRGMVVESDGHWGIFLGVDSNGAAHVCYPHRPGSDNYIHNNWLELRLDIESRNLAPRRRHGEYYPQLAAIPLSQDSLNFLQEWFPLMWRNIMLQMHPDSFSDNTDTDSE